MQDLLFADVILPVAREPFTYLVPDDLREQLGKGSRVKVPFGKKTAAGIISDLHRRAPSYRVKEIECLIPESVPLPEYQLRLWSWMAGYYMCTIGEVMRAAVPAKLKPSEGSEGDFGRSYRNPTVEILRMNPEYKTERDFCTLLDSLKRASAQCRVMTDFLEATGYRADAVVPKANLKSSPALRELIRKNILLLESVSTDDELPQFPEPELPALSPAQKIAFEETKDGGRTVVLHGITGSGKTEIYINLIGEQLAAGKDVFYLVPEIAMSSQLTMRIKEVFGPRLLTYHSMQTDASRARTYNRICNSTYPLVVLGTRSSILVPLRNPGLVIVDEEHDRSYKQDDPAPRFNARDTALVLGQIAGAKVVLGSATPSLETYYNARCDRYRYVYLGQRYGESQTPEYTITDTILSAQRGERRSHFNRYTREAITRTLAEGRQVILFQNRRGMAPYVRCTVCSHIPVCTKCNVSLTLHRDDTLRCHWCGHRRQAPAACPECGGKMDKMGFGTEKIEQETARLFPAARLLRLDRDSVTSVKRYEAIIREFAAGNADILIGTQMVTKGFDFPNVTTVCIMNADNSLYFPDFRAAERTYQLITQTGGRAGRGEHPGEVIIQTAIAGDPTILQAASEDYAAMAACQLKERMTFGFPPYVRLINVYFKHHNAQLLQKASRSFYQAALTAVGNISSPQPPVVEMVRGQYILLSTVRIKRSEDPGRYKKQLWEILGTVHGQKEFRPVRIYFDIDPQ